MALLDVLNQMNQQTVGNFLNITLDDHRIIANGNADIHYQEATMQAMVYNRLRELTMADHNRYVITTEFPYRHGRANVPQDLQNAICDIVVIEYAPNGNPVRSLWIELKQLYHGQPVAAVNEDMERLADASDLNPLYNNGQNPDLNAVMYIGPPVLNGQTYQADDPANYQGNIQAFRFTGPAL